MALFANEGDNNIGGVEVMAALEQLLAHAGEEAGIYEDGYVIVTREAKAGILEASKELRVAQDDVARKAAWKKFAEIAKPLLMGPKVMLEAKAAEGG